MYTLALWHCIRSDWERFRARPDDDPAGSVAPLTVDRLFRLLEEYDPETVAHSRRVCYLSLRLAAALSLDASQRRWVGLAARLHDLGKLGLPRDLLAKPGRLTAPEYRLIQRHTLLGERLLAPLLPEPAVLAGVRSHHERFDGRGYPDGLAGHRIPLPARIIGVADCFDALTSRRPYRPPLSREAALDHLRHRAGTDFDPVVLAAFLGLMQPLRAGSAVRVTTCPAVPLRSRPFDYNPGAPPPRDFP